MADDSPRLRLGVLGVVVFGLFSVLFARLWYLQVMASPHLQQVARANQVRTVSLPPVRGRILDRNGKVLADNAQSIVVTVRRDVIASKKTRDALFAKIAPVVGTTVARLNARYKDGQYSPLLPLPLATIIEKSIAVYLKERLEEFPGVAVEYDPERIYPYGPLAAHVVGYVGRLSPETAKVYAHDCDHDLTSATCYQLSDTVGVAGVEQVFERELRGQPGYMRLEVDAKGRIVQVLQQVSPVPGHDVVLTIDANIQQLAEQALALKLQETSQRGPIDSKTKLPTGELYSAPAGAVVVEDPTDGSILALASYPTFDPREFVRGITKERFDQIYGGEQNHNPLLNRVVQGEYAPASTFKLSSAAATLAYQLKTPDEVYTDQGVYDLHTREPTCKDQCLFTNAGGQVNGPVNLSKALTVSSDVYFYDVGALFDIYRNNGPRGVSYGNALQDEARAFGFGKSTGIQLADEHDGRIPDKQVKQSLHRQFPSAFKDGVWTTGDNMQVVIGQGLVSVTPLQLVNAYATFANGGTLWYPNIVREIDANGTAGTPTVQVLRTIEPRKNNVLQLPAYVRDPILQGLEGVVADPLGTAYQAWKGFPLDQFKVAGKTGTAQDNTHLSENDSSLFVGFGPVSNPRYVVLCIMEKSGFGADAAAPVVRRVFEGFPEVGVFPLDQVEKADPIGAPSSTRITNTAGLLKSPPSNPGAD